MLDSVERCQESQRGGEKDIRGRQRILYELGMIERIICEDEPATDDNIEEIGRIIDRHMREFFQSCAEKDTDETSRSAGMNVFRKIQK